MLQYYSKYVVLTVVLGFGELTCDYKDLTQTNSVQLYTKINAKVQAAEEEKNRDVVQLPGGERQQCKKNQAKDIRQKIHK